MKIYLLSIKDLDEKLDRAMCYLDDKRLEKARKSKPGKSRNQSIGAGLLLQLAYIKWYDKQSDEEIHEKRDAQTDLEMEQWTLETILKSLDAYQTSGMTFPVQIAYITGANGKPDFAEPDIHFNLSHSDDYVCLAIADYEVGIDIQNIRSVNNYRVADRYFSEREKELLADKTEAEKRIAFYRIWVKKEAYAKLTGGGIGKEVGVDTCVLTKDYFYMEPDAPAGYCMAVCCRN